MNTIFEEIINKENSKQCITVNENVIKTASCDSLNYFICEKGLANQKYITNFLIFNIKIVK